jgi:hypothetical protein
MNRKETLGRLLLTLLTAFVMVAGAFAVALPTLTTEVETPASVDVRESDMETRVAGEAPASAFTTETQGNTITERQISESSIPDPMVMEIPETGPTARTERTGTATTEPQTPSSSGTRAATVEAYGPYGTMTDPLYEGEAITFESDVIGDINDNYQFRWDVTGDGVFDGPGAGAGWGAWGESDFDYTFLDNNLGVATVQAWDGTYTTTNYVGNMWEGYDMTCNVGGYYSYTYGNQITIGDNDIIVDRIGGFKAQYWASPYPYNPWYYYNLRLWTTSGALLGQTGALYPADGDWAWGDIPDVTLYSGQSYIVAMHAEPLSTSTYPYYYPHVGSYYYDLQIDDDDAMSFDGYRYYPDHDVFPSYGPYSNSYAWFVDIDYYWEVVVENVIEDTADVWVENVAPIVINPQAVPTTGVEGSGAGFTGSFMDPGLDDEWFYRWDWGDGTQSEWRKVNKYSGGARVLFLHCLGQPSGGGYGMGTLFEDLQDLGPFITQLDEWDYSPAPYGSDSVPELDYLLQYDVVVVGSNYYNSHNAEVGDLLADFSDIKGAQGSGGVITMSFSWYSVDPGLSGRWVDEDYDALDPASSITVGTFSLGTVYDPTHPIMQSVSSISGQFYANYIFSHARGDLIASWNNGMVAVATYGNPYGSGARHAALNLLPSVYFPSGDWQQLIYNAIKWTSRMPDPVLLPQPIQLETMYHIYVDDHPEHVTAADVFHAKLQVKDDDHEKVVPIGGITTFLDEDFSAGVPPSGWYRSGTWGGDWVQYPYNYAGGVAPEAWFYYAYGYGYVGYGRLYTGPIDTTGYTGVDISFREYLSHYSGSYTLSVETSTDGVNWDPVLEYVNPAGFNARTTSLTVTANIGSPTTYFSWTFYGDPWNLNYWCVDDIYSVAFEAYTMSGLGEGSCDVTIYNVYPSAAVPGAFDNVVEEHLTIDFEGFEITDPALMQRTEEFWYRWDYGDGTPIGPWIYKGTIAPPEFKILLLNSWTTSEGPAIINAITNGLEDRGFELLVVDEWNYYYDGAPTLAYLMDYDVVLTSTNYYIYDTTLLATLGDRLADYSDAGGGVIQMTFAGGTSSSGFLGRWYNDDYTPIPYAGNYYGYLSLGDVYDPTHPIMEGIDDMSAYYSHGTTGITSGATRLADFSNGNTLCAYTDIDHFVPGGGRIIGLNFFPWPSYVTGDAMDMCLNSLIWAWGASIPTPVLDTVSHDYGDNGIYTAGLQIIDDDMMWDWAPGDAQPTFTGTDDPNDWVSFVYFPVEVNNVDPVISPRIRAEVNMDLVIRTTGEPKNDCTMTLWKGMSALGSVTVYHEGNYKMETLPATLDMGTINDYYVTVEYENADPDGANPTWIFEGRFPSGHTKELKNVFKEDGTIWTVDSSLLKTMLIGEDIIFTAVGADDGSDDLAFDWQFGDGGVGIHVFANADSSMVEGSAQTAEDIFNAHPNRDPWFDRAPNTIRSPDMNPIRVVDEISHAYMEGGHYFVTVILMDDDVCDGYPSFQVFLNGGGYDMEFYQVDLS